MTSNHTGRARAVTALLVGGLLLGGVVSPVAHAEDLKTRKHRIEKKLVGAHHDLDESSAQLRSAAAALESAQAQLGSAQAHLADTRGQLSAARALDKQMAAELEAARARLVRARADLVTGREKIAAEQDTLGQIVVGNYQSGDPSLLGLSMVLTSQDPAELTGQLNSVRNVIDKEAVVLDRLEASRVLLTVQEREVAAAKAEVARRRKDAAANLVRKKSLESQAEAAEASVQSLVSARASAREQADQAMKADVAQLESLRSEQERIASMFKRRAEAARAAAAVSGSSGGPILGDGGPVHSNGFLNYPVNGAVTSPFGWRIHPIYGYRSLHDGVDFGAACGTPIRAAASGTVVERYFQTAWGNRVIIDHGFHHGVGLATITNHMSGPAVVAPGQHVQRGQVVGYIGSTGWSTGCHLHFTVLQNGTPVDPMSWF